MLLNEILGLGIFPRPITKPSVDKSKKVQPVERVVKTETEPDVKKKHTPKGRIDLYA